MFPCHRTYEKDGREKNVIIIDFEEKHNRFFTMLICYAIFIHELIFVQVELEIEKDESVDFFLLDSTIN